ncbi:MAG: glycerol-3-phosphate acyltransferase [Candidatus Heimdallarchaeota archaeon]|nr:glycerol-3-phosphate acyltransferase [Candidatus Heimdallarchaeota archaeon]
MLFNNIWPFFVAPIMGWLIGGIPTAYIVCKLVANIDPREFGSGSVSTRNTIRAAGLWPWGALTYSVDAVKGAFAAALVEYLIAPLTENPVILTEYLVILTALAAIVGHCWMPFLRFKGGKGLGTYVGILFYFYWPTAFFWIIFLFALIRISGFSGIGACWAATFISPFWFFIDLFFNTTRGLPGAFWPHIYFEINGFGWQFILLYALVSWLLLFLRHLPEFKKIRQGDVKTWSSLKTTEMLK